MLRYKISIVKTNTSSRECPFVAQRMTIDLRRTYRLYWHELLLKGTGARRRRNEQNRFSILQVGDPIRRAIRTTKI